MQFRRPWGLKNIAVYLTPKCHPSVRVMKQTRVLAPSRASGRAMKASIAFWRVNRGRFPWVLGEPSFFGEYAHPMVS